MKDKFEREHRASKRPSEYKDIELFDVFPKLSNKKNIYTSTTIKLFKIIKQSFILSRKEIE